MKKSILAITFSMILAISGLTTVNAQEQPAPQKDTVNMDTDAKPTQYYDIEDDTCQSSKRIKKLIGSYYRYHRSCDRSWRCCLFSSEEEEIIVSCTLLRDPLSAEAKRGKTFRFSALRPLLGFTREGGQGDEYMRKFIPEYSCNTQHISLPLQLHLTRQAPDIQVLYPHLSATLFFCRSNRISAIGVSPFPHSIFVLGGVPFGLVLSFICILNIRS